METILAVAGFCGIVMLAAGLFTYVVVSKKRTSARLYQAAAMQESKGNYAEAITLFEQYLRMNSDMEDKSHIQNRIKTLKTLTAVS